MTETHGHGHEVIREGRHMIRQLQRTLRRRSFIAGLLLALARFFLLLGMIFLVLWSYSVWGSTPSPLGALLWPAWILIAASLGLRLFFGWYAKVLHRAERIERRREKIREKIRFSKLSTRKLDNSGS